MQTEQLEGRRRAQRASRGSRRIPEQGYVSPAQYGYRQLVSLCLFVFLHVLPGHKHNLANITLKSALSTEPRASRGDAFQGYVAPNMETKDLQS